MANFEDLYNSTFAVKMADLISARVDRFVQRLMGIPRYEYSDGRYPGFASEIIGCHYPLRDDHVEHINRVVVGHLMLRCGQLAYFTNRLDPTLSRATRDEYEEQLQHLGKRFRGERIGNADPFPLKQQLVFALAILHDVGKTAFLDDPGHEERGGLLVNRVLTSLGSSLQIDDAEASLGTLLIENHTMLGTLVQGEQSARKVKAAVATATSSLQQHFLYYLLLLNSMDLSGYRYLPIILDPYWASRYITFSDFGTLNQFASNPVSFAEYRLRELARASISDVGDLQCKKAFHEACRAALSKLDIAVQEKIGTIRIRDALYLILDINRHAIGGIDFPPAYAPAYVRFFEALAQIGIGTGAEEVVFRGDPPNPRTVDKNRTGKLVQGLGSGATVVNVAAFHPGSTVQFTIDDNGQIVP